MSEKPAFKLPDNDPTFAQMDNREEYYTITVKLKPYLQEFLKSKLNNAEIMANKRNLVGVILRPFLETRQKDIKPSRHINHDGSQEEGYITFKLPKYDDLNIRNGTVCISEENQKHFQDILEAYFKDFFFSYMDDKVRYGELSDKKRGIVKKIIIQFCSDLNLPFNEINYEMLKKSYYRRQQKKHKKSFFLSSKLSLSCPLFFLI
jgi:hypothetical protein